MGWWKRFDSATAVNPRRDADSPAPGRETQHRVCRVGFKSLAAGTAGGPLPREAATTTSLQARRASSPRSSSTGRLDAVFSL
jgi:hypothetical protein